MKSRASRLFAMTNQFSGGPAKEGLPLKTSKKSVCWRANSRSSIAAGFRKFFLRQVSRHPSRARAMPTRSSDERLRKYANLAAAAARARV